MVRVKIECRDNNQAEARHFHVAAGSPWCDVLEYGSGGALKACDICLSLVTGPKETYDDKLQAVHKKLARTGATSSGMDTVLPVEEQAPYVPRTHRAGRPKQVPLTFISLEETT